MAAESKIEPPHERTPSSIESSPSPEPEASAEPSQEPTQPQKRKGGRKPVCSTFLFEIEFCLWLLIHVRYMPPPKNANSGTDKPKPLFENGEPSTSSSLRRPLNKMKRPSLVSNKAIARLQMNVLCSATRIHYLSGSYLRKVCFPLDPQSRRGLTLFVLLGIDVQAELAMKTASPTLGFQHPAANMPHIPPSRPPLQRTAIQRHQARRSGHFLPKLAPGQSSSDMAFQSSPKGHPTPSSHASSPTSISARSPMIMQHDGFTSPSSAVLTQPQQYPNFSRGPSSQPFYQSQQMSPNAQRPAPPSHHHSSASVMSNHSAGSRQNRTGPTSAGVRVTNAETSTSPLYSNPFQKHIDQLGKLAHIHQLKLSSSPRLTP